MEIKKKKLIVGLGNPGKNYVHTRHNIGFMIIDAFAGEKTHWQLNKKCLAQIAQTMSVLLAKPEIFMNESGKSVAALAHYFKVDPQDVWIVHDDSDMTFGRIKIVTNGRSAGHKGVQSIMDHLHTQRITRFKIGIRPNGVHERSETFVLQGFSVQEKLVLKKFLQNGRDIITHALKHGIDQTMSRYHQKLSTDKTTQNEK